MPTRTHILVLLSSAFGTWALVLWARNIPLTLDQLMAFTSAVTVVGTLVTIFDRWPWRWPIMYGWLAKRPNLRGTWRVRIESEWENPVTRQRIGPITAYMGIEQTFSKITMHLMTAESESWLTCHCIEASQKTTGYTVVGVYQNKPTADLRNGRSVMHFGTLSLDTHGPERRPDSMAGDYWTDRKTRGSIVLSDRRAVVMTRFETAEKTFGKDIH